MLFKFSHDSLNDTMIDTVQIVLLVVIVLMTILLIVLGIQVFLILSEFRGTVKRLNKVLDHADEITKSFSQPINMIAGLFGSGSIASILQIVKLFTGRGKKEKERDDDE